MNPLSASSRRAAAPESAGFAADATAPAAELRLLLTCARADETQASGNEVRSAAAAVSDWDLVRGWAAWHGVTALTAAVLTRWAGDRVPPPVLAELRQIPQTTAVRNLFLLSQLLHLVGRFDAEGIPALAFKGSLLAHTVYADPSLREFSDLDLVVRRKDVRRAGMLLEGLGFAPRPTRDGGTQPPLAARLQYARPYDRVSDGVTVDLHWHLALATFRAGVSMRRLWDETRSYVIGGTSVRSFTPEATLLVLCIHGSKHGPTPWPRLRWVVDVDRLVRRYPDLDWERVRLLAERLGCLRVLLTGTRLSAELLHAPVPESLLHAARADRVATRIVARSTASLLRNPLRSETAPRDIAYRLALRERWRDKLSTLARGALLPKREDWSRVPLPRGMGWLYVPLRAVRLAGKLLLRGEIGAPAAELGVAEPLAGWHAGPLGLFAKLRLAGRVYGDWAAVRWRLHRMRLPELVAWLDRPGGVRLRLEPRRLGRIVYRTMNVGPLRPRCLTMSLVLYRELRRQENPAEVVIGLPPEPRDHTAHAWVEVEREVVGPPPGRLGHVEMARYGRGREEPPGEDRPSV